MPFAHQNSCAAFNGWSPINSEGDEGSDDAAYEKEKAHAAAPMSARQNQPVPEVAKLMGTAEATLYLSRHKQRSAGKAAR